MPAPIAAVSDWISVLATTLSIDARSTLRILPRSGRIACVRGSRASRAEPPAESPSTMNSSVLSRSRGRAVGELVGHAHAVERGLAPGQLTRLLRRGARPRRVRRLADDRLRRVGVLLEPAAEVLVGGALHERADLGVAELRLGLALELRVGEAHRHDRGEALAHVVALERRRPWPSAGCAPWRSG